MGTNVDHVDEPCFWPLDLKEIYSENIQWISKQGDQAQYQCTFHCLVLRERINKNQLASLLPTCMQSCWGGTNVFDSTCCFPLISGDKPLYILNICSKRSGQYTWGNSVSCAMNLPHLAHLLWKEANYRREERNLVWSKHFYRLNGKAWTYK